MIETGEIICAFSAVVRGDVPDASGRRGEGPIGVLEAFAPRKNRREDRRFGSLGLDLDSSQQIPRQRTKQIHLEVPRRKSQTLAGRTTRRGEYSIAALFGGKLMWGRIVTPILLLMPLRVYGFNKID